MMRNHKNVEFVHTIMAIFTGAAAGILGVTGLYGFLMFLCIHAAVSVVILVTKMGGRVSNYLPKSTFGFVIGGAGDHLLSFLLFWTLGYALVHIY